MKKYTTYLINCFLNAKGLDKFDINSKADLSMYTAWLEELKEAGQNFEDMLVYLDMANYKSSNTVEFHKGYVDSLVLDKDAKIITPYKNSFVKPNNNKIIAGRMQVFENMPVYSQSRSKNIIRPLSISIDTLFTHNFDKPKDLNNWANIDPKYNQIIGVFGNIYDKDMYSKINSIKAIHDSHLDIYQENFDTIDDNYLYVINHDNGARVRSKSYRK